MNSAFQSQHALNTSGIIYDIRRTPSPDGPGLRTTICFKGCPLDCWWCHTPESQSPMPEIRLWDERCVRCGRCVPNCPLEAITPEEQEVITDREICTVCGTCVGNCQSAAREIVGERVTAEEILAQIKPDQYAYAQPGGGITFSGGEPLMQRTFLLAVLQGCKVMGLHTAVNTCGYAPWEAFESILPYVDQFLFELKMVDEERHIQFTGVSNKLILQNLRALSDLGRSIILRAPIISGINDDPSSFNDLCSLVTTLNLQRIDLVPYQPASEEQYQSIARSDRLPDLTLPSQDEIQSIVDCLQNTGVPVAIDG